MTLIKAEIIRIKINNKIVKTLIKNFKCKKEMIFILRNCHMKQVISLKIIKCNQNKLPIIKIIMNKKMHNNNCHYYKKIRMRTKEYNR